MKHIIILILGMLSLSFGISGCRNTNKHVQQVQNVGHPIPRATRITIDKLLEVLRNVQAGRTEFNFTGICSNGTDCIYFMQENGKFYIDYEAMSKEQLPYLDSLKQFSKEYGFPVVETTYNNTPVDYDHFQYVPVLSIKANVGADSIVKIGKLIEQSIFRNNDQTIYEIVP
ncbi:hypothetical protein [Duncaniella freteri]|uniref:hypothetical protein n=2 Tax=Duncaniella freteri TaxID=2530391 RepID=UPI001370A67C|nr:hypothetical protein [Duncaniella freteri]NBJ08789.1 hypothetical protein [Alistipes sp. Z76]NCE70792.1 hypothetical protein [Muribaculaceae bacterium M3]